jgi:hypothetical protein
VVVQNTDVYRLEHCPDSYLAQISLRKGAVEHVLHCVGSIKGLAIPRACAEMLSCKLLSTAAVFVSHMM